MDVSDILDVLNKEQRQAVSSNAKRTLVLAGAGSGKTRVLVHRIAWLLGVEGVSPYGILAVTFTNKAAAEMRSRIETLTHSPGRGMWVGTFHGLAHRLLRTHHKEAGLSENFQILDSDDQLRLVKRTIKALGLDETHWPAKQAQWFINHQKDEGLRPKHLQQQYKDSQQQTLVSIYQAYEEACKRGDMVDFAELLLRSHELWLNNPALLKHYQDRFQHILVDEFQDTNAVQYAWLQMLAGDNNSMMIVGDDDQSIYGWRGAKVENIQHFSKKNQDVEIIRMEQNYRSTSNILQAANAVIDNNQNRFGKKLWTEGNEGELISVYAGFNEVDEARFIVDQIQSEIDKGLARDEMAILYRSNAQSRVLEEALIRAGIPYRIYGGQRFFDRAEIKNALAYLRLISNRFDDVAFERIVNTPTRGMGQKTLELIRAHARANNISMWQSSLKILEANELTARAGKALELFLALIDKLNADTANLNLGEQAEHVIECSGLIAHHKKEKGEKAQARLENLQELVTACSQFDFDEEKGAPSPLSAFLDHAALEAGENQADANESSVQLMTLHSAKGLEFKIVFMSGVEEGLFPSKQSDEEPGRLEEERRLCYVGITRAEEKLFLSYAESRRLYGRETFNTPSRFIREIPPQLMQEIRIQASITRPTQFSPSSIKQGEAAGFQLGQKVKHPKFGEGVVLNCEGQGNNARLQINFMGAGSKWLVAQYARLEIL